MDIKNEWHNLKRLLPNLNIIEREASDMLIHRTRTAVVTVLTLATMTLTGFSVQAQEFRSPREQQKTLTVEEAIAHGLVHNPGLRAIRKINDIAEGEVISAAILRNTSIAVAFGRSEAKSGAAAEEHDEEEEMEEMEEMEEPDDTTVTNTRGVTVSQSFDIAGQRPVHLLMARANLDQARLVIAEAEIDLVRNIRRACAEYLALTDGMAEIHNVMYAAKPYIWELTEGRPSDRRRALTDFLNMQQDSRTTRQAVMRAETEINTLLGLPPDTRLLIVGSLEPEPIPITYEQLKDSIFARNLNIRSAIIEIRAARYALDLAMRDKVPGVDVSFTAGRSNSSGDISRSRDYALGMGVDLFRQVVEQNRGQIMSARAGLEFSEDALDDARRELENEIYALYQDLNLTRVRIRVLEHGHLAQLERLVLETDLDDYEDGKIEIDTWLMDVMRYHMRGETMLALKALYISTLGTLEFLAGGSFDQPADVPVESEDLPKAPKGYVPGMVAKAGVGIGNVVLSPVEIPAAWYGYTRDRGVFGFVAGPFEGVVTTIERAAAGLIDVVTAPVPWPVEDMQPLSLPVLDRNPWAGSWSLNYIHPAYKKAPVFEYGGNSNDEGSK